MPDNNFYLLRANINNDYLENYVWSKCGRKYGFEAIDHSNKSLSYNILHYTCGRVVEFFRKQKILWIPSTETVSSIQDDSCLYNYISLKGTVL